MNKQPQTAKNAKRAAVRRKKAGRADRLAQIVTLLATIMAATYVIIRIVNWIRFF